MNHGPSTPEQLLAGMRNVGTGRVRHVEHRHAREAREVPWPVSVPPLVRSAFEGKGVASLWSHQAEAIEKVITGRHVVVATGAASGKSLAYQVPMLSAALDGEHFGRPSESGARGPGGRKSGPGDVTVPTSNRSSGLSALRGATALYLSPTKALAADQRNRLERLHVRGARIATLDGDTPLDERQWIRRHVDIVLTNPDLLHHSLLPDHERWSLFFRALRLVVIDEFHVYRGVFGAHTAAIIRRLRRIVARYSAEPTFVLAAATSGEPARHAHEFTGLDVEAIVDDGSPRPALAFALWEPGTSPGTASSGLSDEPETTRPGTSEPGKTEATRGETGRTEPVKDLSKDDEQTSDRTVPDQDDVAPPAPEGRRSAVLEEADLFAALVEQNVQTLAFARSRVGVEVMADIARHRLQHHGLDPRIVAAYRGGYLPEERRVLERGLRDGTLRGIAATSALELNIDVSGLDAVVLAGWPGTVASLHQQAGRAGRSERDALAVFVAADDPLDTYLVDHPDVFFARPVEATVMDPGNPYVLGPQLAYAAAELPLTEADVSLFGPAMWPLVDSLVQARVLRRRPAGWFWARDDRPADHVSLRGSGADDVRIVETRTGHVLGTVDGERAHSAVHRGAVYVHQRRSFVVTDIDLEDGSAHVTPGNPGQSTAARAISSCDILSSQRSCSWGAVSVHYGTIRVRSRVTSFLCRLPSGEVIGEHPLDLSERELVTKGVWWTVPTELLEDAGADDDIAPGALHAAAHCSLGLISLVTQGDRWDVGGVINGAAPRHGAAHGRRVRRVARQVRVRRTRLRTGRLVVACHEGRHRVVRLRRRVPSVHPVAEVRQRQPPARQGRGDHAVRRRPRRGPRPAGRLERAGRRQPDDR